VSNLYECVEASGWTCVLPCPALRQFPMDESSGYGAAGGAFPADGESVPHWAPAEHTADSTGDDPSSDVNASAPSSQDDEASYGGLFGDEAPGDELQEFLAEALGDISLAQPEVREPLLESFDVEGVAKHILTGKARRIVVMCGAGISVSAGIPDFRSPGTGLYDNLQKYNLPHPEAVFDIDYFRETPGPFYLLARELFPGQFNPTPTHHFIKLLHDKGLLLRCYTQNIDSLESQAGLPPNSLIAAHGNFDSASCIQCKAKYSQLFAKSAVESGTPPLCEVCGGLIKPDIVFFGENLPPRFFQHYEADLSNADLLIVMGTSLTVNPFAALIDMVRDETPRLLINRERAGERRREMDLIAMLRGHSPGGFVFGEGNYRDALFLGDCDAGVRHLASLLGWHGELKQLIDNQPSAH